MGNFPEERISPNAKPFKAICVDLLGPTMVKAMVNKRAHLKVWPIVFVCQATGALHIKVAHDYGAAAFSLQYYVALRNAPQKVVSDRGSQLTSASHLVAWTERESPSNWDWNDIKEKGRGRAPAGNLCLPGASIVMDWLRAG